MLRVPGRLVAATLLAGLLLVPAAPCSAQAKQKKKATTGKKSSKKKTRKPLVRKKSRKSSGKKKAKPKSPKLPALKTPADKRKFLELIRHSMPVRRVSTKIRYLSGDLDRSLEYRIKLPASRFAPQISDERFVRRAYLDLVGKPPRARVVSEFVADETRRKRARLIDQLLVTRDYSRKWARYWTNVIFYDSTAKKNRVSPKALENWLAEEFHKGSRWDRIVAELVSAMPVRNKGQKKNKNEWGQKTGPNNFVLAYDDKPVLVAAQTARIFMGISIQCAECHDHPFDRWKREQFHELAAFFSKGKYFMTAEGNPAKKTEMQPRFLLGEKPPPKLTRHQRRVAVAAYLVYNQDNYWFARSFVNRVWNELVGDGFYAVDSLGPGQDAYHTAIVNRIAAIFRYRDFDPKWVFRLLMNSMAYQREIRTIEDDAALFTAVRPSRLRAAAVIAATQNVTGPDKNLRKQLGEAFKVDPSIPQRDLEGSIQQALLMLNSRTLETRLKNSGLKKRLVAINPPRRLLEQLYLGTLARRPTDKEIKRGLTHLRKVPNRAEAIEDLLWVLVNSTEFITKR